MSTTPPHSPELAQLVLAIGQIKHCIETHQASLNTQDKEHLLASLGSLASHADMIAYLEERTNRTSAQDTLLATLLGDAPEMASIVQNGLRRFDDNTSPGHAP